MLMRGDRHSGGGLTRVGRIVRLMRPGIALTNRALPGPPPPLLPSGLREHMDALQQIAAAYSRSVGRIDVRQSDGAWMRVGTGWVVNAGGGGRNARILTAGHVLTYMLNSGRPVTRRLGRLAVGTGDGRALRQTRITFADRPDPAAQGIDIAAVIWPHGLWDAMLCELDRPLDLAPEKVPPLEIDPGRAQGRDDPVAVLGYPAAQGFVPPALVGAGGLASVFEGELGILRLCPGRCLNPDAMAGPGRPTTHQEAAARLMAHDASTLGGNSGSPIFNLLTRHVVALHTSGGQFFLGGPEHPDEANRGVPIPLLLAEARMREEIDDALPSGSRTPAERQPPAAWSPALADPDDEGVSPFIGTDPADLPPALLAAAVADRPDTRDRFYAPPMTAPRDAVLPGRDPRRRIHNQRSEPACVGFALAALIDVQRRATDPEAKPVSARMLYEMALAQDEWIEDGAGGTSLRAGIKGFFHSGVCGADVAPFVPGQQGWAFTRRAARDARNVTAGAYFRLRPQLADFQSAIQELGAVAVAAHIHAGWIRSDGKRIHSIRHSQERIGAHAFAVIGYDAAGFIVQNSWGPDWGGWGGRDGMAHWSYADWAENLIDAWIVRLAPSSPSAFGLTPASGAAAKDDGLPAATAALPRAPRHALLGHVIHAERDGIVEAGRLGLGLGALREAVGELNANELPECPQLAILHHDPFLGAEAISRIAAHMTPVFLKNGIFPLHIAYGVDEVATVAARMRAEAALVSERFGRLAVDGSAYLEHRAARLCGRILADFAAEADTAARPGGSLWQAGAALCIEAAKGRVLSLLSFGTGSIAAAAQIDEAMRRNDPKVTRFLQIAPVALPKYRNGYTHRIWPLGHDRQPGDLPPFACDWVDLVQTALGQKAFPLRAGSGDRTNTPGTLAACCSDPSLLNALLAEIRGRPPSPTRRFA
ncbi:trypsin-like peptidase domain-containing protein [Paracoccus stylophorae]|uniref:Trypsin-like peptidase domain-containing protein n=1 Tax=Paracoccus stylophorae TaxID=659350 RepID=A0ABY7SYJ9_9RHOB|nr:trypsin-like peptidase domain-containing protein [Paracoccus stylophorae]WCR11943.1 trypsin-like peptidase domain-containing protein [Paracoccus stylophorae]